MSEAPQHLPSGKARVVMLVANGCANDARVIKEAESLARHGHLVRVVCVAEPGLASFAVSNGVAYERCVLPQRRVARLVGRTPDTQASGMPRTGSASREESLVTRLKSFAGPFLEHELLAAGLAGPAVRFRPDIVHAHDFNVLPAALRVAARSGASIIYDMHEMEEGRLPAAGPVLARLKGAIEARAFKRIAAAITVSPSIAGHYAQKHGIERPALVLNAPLVHAGRRLGETVRERAGLGPDVPLAVYTGVLAEGRGNEHMLDAVAMTEGIALALVGPIRPAMRSKLDEVMSRKGMAGRIHVLGSVPHEDVVPFIASADIGICTISPSCLNYEYCLPNKLFEMTFAGLPLVVSRNVELARFVREAGNGIPVPADDPQSIAGAMLHILASRARYTPSPARLAGLIDMLDWRAQERTLIEIYERVLAARAGADRAA
jgi:glycosyltransferase involved in cell wall biosynthesis